MAMMPTSFRRSCLPETAAAERLHLRVLAGVRCRRRLSARVRVDLRVHDHDVDVHPRRQQPRQSAEADVQDGAVAADGPELLVLPANLVPAQPNAHCVRNRVFEERVRPGHEVRVERIAGGVDAVAAGRRDDRHVLRPVHEAGRGQHHPDRCRFAAAHARSRAADVEQRAVGQHHVRRAPCR